jgi:hypothetical protein
MTEVGDSDKEPRRAALLRHRAKELEQIARRDPFPNRRRYFNGLASSIRAAADLLAPTPPVQEIFRPTANADWVPHPMSAFGVSR